MQSSHEAGQVDRMSYSGQVAAPSKYPLRLV